MGMVQPGQIEPAEIVAALPWFWAMSAAGHARMCEEYYGIDAVPMFNQVFHVDERMPEVGAILTADPQVWLEADAVPAVRQVVWTHVETNGLYPALAMLATLAEERKMSPVFEDEALVRASLAREAFFTQASKPKPGINPLGYQTRRPLHEWLRVEPVQRVDMNAMREESAVVEQGESVVREESAVSNVGDMGAMPEESAVLNVDGMGNAGNAASLTWEEALRIVKEEGRLPSEEIADWPVEMQSKLVFIWSGLDEEEGVEPVQRHEDIDWLHNRPAYLDR